MASMGLAPLALLDDPDLEDHPVLARLMRFVYDRVNINYDFKLLYRYKAKYHPHTLGTTLLLFQSTAVVAQYAVRSRSSSQRDSLSRCCSGEEVFRKRSRHGNTLPRSSSGSVGRCSRRRRNGDPCGGSRATDHYDPDDTKTWPDVVSEDRDVVCQRATVQSALLSSAR